MVDLCRTAWSIKNAVIRQNVNLEYCLTFRRSVLIINHFEVLMRMTLPCSSATTRTTRRRVRPPGTSTFPLYVSSNCSNFPDPERRRTVGLLPFISGNCLVTFLVTFLIARSSMIIFYFQPIARRFLRNVGKSSSSS